MGSFVLQQRAAELRADAGKQQRNHNGDGMEAGGDIAERAGRQHHQHPKGTGELRALAGVVRVSGVQRLRPVTEEEVIRVRRKAGKAVQAVFRQLGLSPISDEQVEAVTYAHGSKDTLDRDVTADLMAAEDVLKRGITGVDVVKALAESGYEDVAMDVLNMLKQRVIGDYMQTAAILDREFHVLSGVNTPNDYMGPGTGYRVEGERWEEIKKIPHIINPQDI